MKKLALALSFVLLGAGVQATAQQKAGAQFKFTEEVHDFGVVKRGPIADHTFEFTNTGTEPLIIMNVTPSCGCTDVTWPKEPVYPGKKGTIHLGLKTVEQHGVFNKEVYIQSNAPAPGGAKRYTLYIKGNAVGDDPK
ncbi:MAG: DUF1573 domain-containing protein [Bacteroidota bacterium]